MALKSSRSLRLLPIAPFSTRQRPFVCEANGEGAAEVHAQLGASCERFANGLHLEGFSQQPQYVASRFNIYSPRLTSFLSQK